MKTKRITPDRLRELAGQDTVTQPEAEQLLVAARVKGVPPADGFNAEGEPWWYTRSLVAWAADPQRVHVRARPPELRKRRGAIVRRPAGRRARRSETWSAATGEFEAVVATETAAQVWDAEVGEYVFEILAADGGEFPERVVMLDAHVRDSARDVIGSFGQFRREGNEWLGVGQLAEDELERFGGKIADGSLDAVSIGYVVRDKRIVAPGGAVEVFGRTFRNGGNSTLVVATRWEVKEVSLVPVGADENARIRSENGEGTVSTTLMNRDALVAAARIAIGESDPSRSMVAVDRDGPVRIDEGSRTIRAAEVGEQYAQLPFHELAMRALELDGHRFERRSLPDFEWQLFQIAQRQATTANFAAFLQGTVLSVAQSRADAAGDSTRGWCREDDAINFLPRDIVTAEPVQLEPLAKGGAAHDFRFSARAEGGRLFCYAGKGFIDEIDILNGDANQLLSEFARAVGDAWSSMRPNLVYAVLRRNAAMSDGTPLFDEAHGNVVSPATLDATRLSAAMTKVAAQRANGIPLNLRAQFLVVPQALELTASALAVTLFSGDPDAQRPPIVRSDSRLDNGFSDPESGVEFPGDPTTWYMVASDGTEGVTVSYLAGTNRLPAVRTGLVARLGEFGISLDSQFAIGCTAHGWRGLVRVQAEEGS